VRDKEGEREDSRRKERGETSLEKRGEHRDCADPLVGHEVSED
jgi:hypothetical protein